MPGQTISFEGDYNSLGRYVTFPFEILGNNFALDANFDNSFVEFTDLVLSTSNKQAQLPFQVYPNPAQQTISFDSEEPIYKVDLYTIEGKLVKSLQVNALSLIHISEPTRRTPISYAVFCLKKKK